MKFALKFILFVVLSHPMFLFAGWGIRTIKVLNHPIAYSSVLVVSAFMFTLAWDIVNSKL